MKSFTLVLLVFTGAFLGLYADRSHRLGGADAIRLTDPLKIYSDMSIDSLIVVMQADTIDFDQVSLRWAASELRYSQIKSGRYVFEKPTSMVDFLTRLVKGRQDPVQLVVPTARFLNSISTRISNQMRFSVAEFDSTVRDSSLLARLGVKREHIVGRLLPDTYEFYWTATPEEVIVRVHNTFKERVEHRFASRLDSIGWTVDQATTMASIIEWEVKHVDEMARVSGLYWNRLRVGMPLQADPTVNFAIGERRRLFFSDYRFNHPYNTYRHRGLPPGPLNNPRIVAIEAAIYPEKHGYFYMVANSEGYHTFTKTFTDHKIEARKWSRWLSEQVKRREEAATPKVSR
jgi:UPF0755 protein